MHDAPSPRVLLWDDLPDPAPVAALLGMAVEDVRAELAGMPEGIACLALVEGGRATAAGLRVRAGVIEAGRADLVWLSAGAAAPALRLVESFEAEALRDGARALTVGVRRAPDVGRSLEARGWRAVPGMIEMRRGEALAPGPLPAGVAERTLAEVGLEAWRTVWNASFEGVPFTTAIERGVLERLVQDPAFDAGLVRVLVDPEGPVAFLHGSLSRDGVGEVHDIGVLSRARGRGLGRWTLRRSAELLARAGAREIILRVAEANVTARRLYEAEGWAEVSRALRWRRDV